MDISEDESSESIPDNNAQYIFNRLMRVPLALRNRPNGDEINDPHERLQRKFICLLI